MEVLSIQQHARDTLSRLRMRKRNKNWARDHMRYHPKDWAGICWLVVGLGWRLVVLLLTLGCDCGLHREQGCLGVKGRCSLLVVPAAGGLWPTTEDVATVLTAQGWGRHRNVGKGGSTEADLVVVAGQRLGGPAQRLDRGGWWMCGVWTEAGQRRIWVWTEANLGCIEVGQRWRLVAIELRFGLLLRQCGG
ncbi:hypothetical protein Acr_08g0008130 [Actinidia rufa]|uniref:Uncharacterized protein n=1 Tax=Actinidia rufa TaxID=165716 RepID=A0A7J0F3E4_9ERIC|nr:hypothetical protein Acr_08g0008130 [Actinidia rufa]